MILHDVKPLCSRWNHLSYLVLKNVDIAVPHRSTTSFRTRYWRELYSPSLNIPSCRRDLSKSISLKNVKEEKYVFRAEHYWPSKERWKVVLSLQTQGKLYSYRRLAELNSFGIVPTFLYFFGLCKRYITEHPCTVVSWPSDGCNQIIITCSLKLLERSTPWMLENVRFQIHTQYVRSVAHHLQYWEYYSQIPRECSLPTFSVSFFLILIVFSYYHRLAYSQTWNVVPLRVLFSLGRFWDPWSTVSSVRGTLHETLLENVKIDVGVLRTFWDLVVALELFLLWELSRAMPDVYLVTAVLTIMRWFLTAGHVKRKWRWGAH